MLHVLLLGVGEGIWWVKLLGSTDVFEGFLLLEGADDFGSGEDSFLKEPAFDYFWVWLKGGGFGREND